MHVAETFDEVCHKMAALRSLHKNADIPTVTERQSQLNLRFAQATELANSLQVRLTEFRAEQEEIEGEIDDAVVWLADVRERLASLEDVSGEDEALVSRLQVTQVGVGVDSWMPTPLWDRLTALIPVYILTVCVRSDSTVSNEPAYDFHVHCEFTVAMLPRASVELCQHSANVESLGSCDPSFDRWNNDCVAVSLELCNFERSHNRYVTVCVPYGQTMRLLCMLLCASPCTLTSMC